MNEGKVYDIDLWFLLEGAIRVSIHPVSYTHLFAGGASRSLADWRLSGRIRRC